MNRPRSWNELNVKSRSNMNIHRWNMLFKKQYLKFWTLLHIWNCSWNNYYIINEDKFISNFDLYVSIFLFALGLGKLFNEFGSQIHQINSKETFKSYFFAHRNLIGLRYEIFSNVTTSLVSSIICDVLTPFFFHW
jgi:hypothetical protein